MRFTQNTKGFTLIELLVVITIIGILAVGGTATYTTQIQKARDSNRLTDLEALRSGIEQFYQDFAEYPLSSGDANEFGSGGKTNGAVDSTRSVARYVPKIPRDSKTGQTCNKGSETNPTACDYIYMSGDDANGIKSGKYRISTGFENAGNVSTKAGSDGGNEPNRFEFGLDLKNTAGGTATSTKCDRVAAGVSDASSNYTRIIRAADCTDSIAGILIAGTAP